MEKIQHSLLNQIVHACMYNWSNNSNINRSCEAIGIVSRTTGPCGPRGRGGRLLGLLGGQEKSRVEKKSAMNTTTARPVRCLSALGFWPLVPFSFSPPPPPPFLFLESGVFAGAASTSRPRERTNLPAKSREATKRARGAGEGGGGGGRARWRRVPSAGAGTRAPAPREIHGLRLLAGAGGRRTGRSWWGCSPQEPRPAAPGSSPPSIVGVRRGRRRKAAERRRLGRARVLWGGCGLRDQDDKVQFKRQLLLRLQL